MDLFNFDCKIRGENKYRRQNDECRITAARPYRVTVSPS